jgi:hypothetical protein
MFGGAVSILARSLVSKTVDVEEVGKAFVVVGILEAVLGVCGAPLYGLIYGATLTTLPGLVFLITLALGLLSLAIFL